MFGRIVKTAVESIETKLGGHALIINNEAEKTVKINWVKNPKTVNGAQFEKQYSYEEFEKLVTSSGIAEDFLASYKEEKKVAKETKAEEKVAKEAEEVEE